MESKNARGELILQDVIDALKKRWRVVILIALSITIVTAFVSFFLIKLILNANVQIIENATLPANPVSPNKMRNILIALLLGIITGMGVAIILECKNSTFSDKEKLGKK